MKLRNDVSAQAIFAAQAAQLSRSRRMKDARLGALVEFIDCAPDDEAIACVIDAANQRVIEGLIDPRGVLDRILVPAIYYLNEPRLVHAVIERAQQDVVAMAAAGGAIGDHRADALMVTAIGDGLRKLIATRQRPWIGRAHRLADEFCDILRPELGHAPELCDSLLPLTTLAPYLRLPPVRKSQATPALPH